MSNKVNEISENLLNFVNSNKSSFTAVQIHSFVNSILSMRRAYNSNISDYQNEVTGSFQTLNSRYEFLEKFTKELKGSITETTNKVVKLNGVVAELGQVCGAMRGDVTELKENLIPKKVESVNTLLQFPEAPPVKSVVVAPAPCESPPTEPMSPKKK